MNNHIIITDLDKGVNYVILRGANRIEQLICHVPRGLIISSFQVSSFQRVQQRLAKNKHANK
jgi:hypothetical protein